jgi:hypothetical protein
LCAGNDNGSLSTNVLLQETDSKADSEYLDLIADQVLVTASLGVLQSGLIEFDPPLPPWKHESIHRLGFGLINKIVLEFPRVFWSNDDHFGVLPLNDSTSAGRFYTFWNLANAMGKPVLVGLAVGNAAYEYERLPHDELVAHAMQILRSIFGTDVPNPLQTFCTRWHEEKFARGSYSFIKVGGSGSDYDGLMRPVGNTLFFAGEATNKHHPATVPGAYLSGVRAAGRMHRNNLPSAYVWKKPPKAGRRRLAVRVKGTEWNNLSSQISDTASAEKLRDEELTSQRKKRGLRQNYIDPATNRLNIMAEKHRFILSLPCLALFQFASYYLISVFWFGLIYYLFLLFLYFS